MVTALRSRHTSRSSFGMVRSSALSGARGGSACAGAKAGCPGHASGTITAAMTGETTKVLAFPADRSAGRLLPRERIALEIFAIAHDADTEFANFGDQGNDKPGAACDWACLDLGDRLIWKVVRTVGETNIVVLRGEMTAGRSPTLAAALDMLGREAARGDGARNPLPHCRRSLSPDTDGRAFPLGGRCSSDFPYPAPGFARVSL